jgi:hypothetical protein
MDFAQQNTERAEQATGCAHGRAELEPEQSGFEGLLAFTRNA